MDNHNDGDYQNDFNHVDYQAFPESLQRRVSEKYLRTQQELKEQEIRERYELEAERSVQEAMHNILEVETKKIETRRREEQLYEMIGEKAPPVSEALKVSSSLRIIPGNSASSGSVGLGSNGGGNSEPQRISSVLRQPRNMTRNPSAASTFSQQTVNLHNNPSTTSIGNLNPHFAATEGHHFADAPKSNPNEEAHARGSRAPHVEYYSSHSSRPTSKSSHTSHTSHTSHISHSSSSADPDHLHSPPAIKSHHHDRLREEILRHKEEHEEHMDNLNDIHDGSTPDAHMGVGRMHTNSTEGLQTRHLNPGDHTAERGEHKLSGHEDSHSDPGHEHDYQDHHAAPGKPRALHMTQERSGGVSPGGREAQAKKQPASGGASSSTLPSTLVISTDNPGSGKQGMPTSTSSSSASSSSSSAQNSTTNANAILPSRQAGTVGSVGSVGRISNPNSSSSAAKQAGRFTGLTVKTGVATTSSSSAPTTTSTDPPTQMRIQNLNSANINQTSAGSIASQAAASPLDSHLREQQYQLNVTTPGGDTDLKAKTRILRDQHPETTSSNTSSSSAGFQGTVGGIGRVGAGTVQRWSAANRSAAGNIAKVQTAGLQTGPKPDTAVPGVNSPSPFSGTSMLDTPSAAQVTPKGSVPKPVPKLNISMKVSSYRAETRLGSSPRATQIGTSPRGDTSQRRTVISPRGQDMLKSGMRATRTTEIQHSNMSSSSSSSSKAVPSTTVTPAAATNITKPQDTTTSNSSSSSSQNKTQSSQPPTTSSQNSSQPKRGITPTAVLGRTPNRFATAALKHDDSHSPQSPLDPKEQKTREMRDLENDIDRQARARKERETQRDLGEIRREVKKMGGNANVMSDNSATSGRDRGGRSDRDVSGGGLVLGGLGGGHGDLNHDADQTPVKPQTPVRETPELAALRREMEDLRLQNDIMRQSLAEKTDSDPQYSPESSDVKQRGDGRFSLRQSKAHVNNVWETQQRAFDKQRGIEIQSSVKGEMDKNEDHLHGKNEDHDELIRSTSTTIQDAINVFDQIRERDYGIKATRNESESNFTKPREIAGYDGYSSQYKDLSFKQRTYSPRVKEIPTEEPDFLTMSDIRNTDKNPMLYDSDEIIVDRFKSALRNAGDYREESMERFGKLMDVTESGRKEDYAVISDSVV